MHGLSPGATVCVIAIAFGHTATKPTAMRHPEPLFAQPLRAEWSYGPPWPAGVEKDAWHVGPDGSWRRRHHRRRHLRADGTGGCLVRGSRCRPVVCAGLRGVHLQRALLQRVGSHDPGRWVGVQVRRRRVGAAAAAVACALTLASTLHPPLVLPLAPAALRPQRWVSSLVSGSGGISCWRWVRRRRSNRLVRLSSASPSLAPCLCGYVAAAAAAAVAVAAVATLLHACSTSSARPPSPSGGVGTCAPC